MRCPSCTMINPDGMRFCGKCGSPLKDEVVIRERRTVSVVFIDLSGFSSLTRNWIPEQLRDLADEILTVVAGIIEDYDGYVDAFQGDGLIALFGAPRSHPDDPYRAVLAAHAGLKAIEAIGDSKGYGLKGRAGVNTGVVIAGSVGSGSVRDYTVMGSAVNLAARLESAAQPGEVWAGEETVAATRHLIDYETVAPVSLSGFPNITEAHKLVAFVDAITSDPYAHLDFIGRPAEQQLLKKAYQNALGTKHARTLWLVGEAGSGKTRLAREFTAQLERTQQAKTIHVEAQPLDRGAAWRQLAEGLFGVSRSGEADWQERVAEQVRSLLPGEPRWQGYILDSLLSSEERVWRRLERRAVNRTFLAWRDLLLTYAKTLESGEGLVLVIEHGPKTASFHELPDLLAEADIPLLLLRTSREPDLASDHDALHLSPLDLDESLALVDQVANPLLKVATESLVFQVGGIPANLLELGRALSVTPQTSFSGSLASLLQARLDMLSASSRRLLSLAALSGERFWGNLVTTITDIGDAEALRELVTEKLILQEPRSLIPGESEYRFQSELVRRAVLRMIPFGERALFHLNIAAWLEENAPLTLSEVTGHHYKEGGSSEAAYPHYLAAADLAVNEEVFDTAFGLFDILLSLPLAPHLLAQAALAYAQAAISSCELPRALEQLNAADGWIELSTGESHDALRQVHQKLFSDLKASEE